MIQNNITEEKGEQFRIKVTASLFNVKPPPSNVTPKERKAATSLSKEQDICILSADKVRCTVVLNTSDYNRKVTASLDDFSTYEAFKRNPTSLYKKKVISNLQKLQKDKVINQTLY